MISQTLPPPARLTPAEYLAFEQASGVKHEYADGCVQAVSGASLRHATIVGNLVAILGGQLRGRGCRVLAGDMRVRMPSPVSYAYPDVMVVCGAPRLEDGVVDTLLNPALIVEVRSPATRDFDRGEKWVRYRQIDSLREYLTVAQDRPHVERYTRQGERLWLLSETADLRDSVELESIGCVLELSGLYEQVGLGEPAGTPQAGARETTQ